MDLFLDNIFIFFFGMGSGTPIYLNFIGEYVYAIEIAPLRSSTSEIINLASIAAYSSEVIDYKID